MPKKQKFPVVDKHVLAKTISKESITSTDDTLQMSSNPFNKTSTESCKILDRKIPIVSKQSSETNFQSRNNGPNNENMPTSSKSTTVSGNLTQELSLAMKSRFIAFPIDDLAGFAAPPPQTIHAQSHFRPLDGEVNNDNRKISIVYNDTSENIGYSKVTGLNLPGQEFGSPPRFPIPDNKNKISHPRDKKSAQCIKFHSKPTDHKIRESIPDPCPAPPRLKYPCAFPRSMHSRKHECKTCEIEINCSSETGYHPYALQNEHERNKFINKINKGENKQMQFISASVLRDKRLQNEIQQRRCNPYNTVCASYSGQDLTQSEDRAQKHASLFLCDSRILQPPKDSQDTNSLIKMNYLWDIKMPLKASIGPRKNQFSNNGEIDDIFGIDKDKRNLLLEMLRQCMTLLKESNSINNKHKHTGFQDDRSVVSNFRNTSFDSNASHSSSSKALKRIDSKGINMPSALKECDKKEMGSTLFASEYRSKVNTTPQSTSSVVLLSERFTFDESCHVTRSTSNSTVRMVKCPPSKHCTEVNETPKPIDRFGIKHNHEAASENREEMAAHCKRNVKSSLSPKQIFTLDGTDKSFEKSKSLNTKVNLGNIDNDKNARRIDSLSSLWSEEEYKNENKYCDVKKSTDKKTSEKVKKYKKYKIFFRSNRSNSNIDSKRGGDTENALETARKKCTKKTSCTAHNHTSSPLSRPSSYVRIWRETSTKSKNKASGGSGKKCPAEEEEDISSKDLEERIGGRLRSVVEETKELEKDIATLKRRKERAEK